MAREVAEYFADPAQNLTPYQTVDADHRRIETRLHRVSHDVDWLLSDRRSKGESRLPGLTMIACVQSTRRIGEAVTTATRTYLSSVRLSPEAFARAVRAHWSTRNSLRLRSPTWNSTRTAPATARTTARKTSAFCENSRSTCSARQDQTSPSPENANAQDGPTTSPNPSSAKCDSPAPCRFPPCPIPNPLLNEASEAWLRGRKHSVAN